MSDAPHEHIDLLSSADGTYSVAPDGNVEPLDAAEPNREAAHKAEPPAEDASAHQDTSSHEDTAQRPWIGIRFTCCGVYRRVYREPHESWYVGRCPCCGREARLRVGPNGTHARIFVAKPL